jgi:hypothetical protein
MKLKEALKKKKFVVTSEVQSPIDQEPEDLVETLSRVRGQVDGVSLSEVELEGVVGDTIKTCQLLNKNLLERIYHTTASKIYWCSPKITALPETACRK